MADISPEIDLISTDDLAEIFHKKPRTIQRWVKLNRLPKPARPGGPHSTPYWSRKAIYDFIEAGSIGEYRRIRRHQ